MSLNSCVAELGLLILFFFTDDVSVLISIYELFSVILGAGSKENLNLFFKSDGLATTFKLLGKRSEYSTAPAEMLKFSVKLIETIDVICTTDVCQAKILEMKDFFFELAQTFEFKKVCFGFIVF